MTNIEKRKRYEFVKLCSALTKQGFNFTILKGLKNAIAFNKNNYATLPSDFVKTPFVNAVIFKGFDRNNWHYQFEQWIDTQFKK